MKTNDSVWTIEKQLQVKQEKKARGTWGWQFSPSPGAVKANQGKSIAYQPHCSGPDASLEQVFTGLLMSSPESLERPETGKKQGLGHIEGTDAFLKTLKRQENTNHGGTKSIKASHFELNLDGVGKVLVAVGGFTDGLSVELKFPTPLPVDGQRVVVQLLNRQLSNLVGVHVEVKIGN